MQKSISQDTGKKDQDSVRALISAVDKAAKRGIVHRNAANRHKARLKKAMTASTAPAAA